MYKQFMAQLLEIAPTSLYDLVQINILPLLWFHNVNLSKKNVISFSHLRYGHILLSFESFILEFNDFFLYTLHNHPMDYDICEKCYIGQTKRNIGIRLKEHIRNIKNDEIYKSLISEYVFEENHCIQTI